MYVLCRKEQLTIIFTFTSPKSTTSVLLMLYFEKSIYRIPLHLQISSIIQLVVVFVFILILNVLQEECEEKCSHLVEIEDQKESDWLAATFLSNSK
jgi:hypothetical protein